MRVMARNRCHRVLRNGTGLGIRGVHPASLEIFSFQIAAIMTAAGRMGLMTLLFGWDLGFRRALIGRVVRRLVAPEWLDIIFVPIIPELLKFLNFFQLLRRKIILLARVFGDQI